MNKLPTDAEYDEIVMLAKLQFSRWGLLDPESPSMPFVRNVDHWVRRTKSHNLAESLAVCLDIGGSRISMSQHRRHLAILAIHAIEEINELRSRIPDDALTDLFNNTLP